ncbi:M20/M25/M40 family metallo-hydrolase [bacterium]|nr:MAG: M20/M25/M40 family metallo-hydrolase [bacterium]
MRPLAVLAFLPALAAAQYPGSTPIPANLKKGWDTVTIKDAKAWLGYLAGPETYGRGTGQDGFQKAAEFVAKKFKEFGLKPVGDNGSYFQNVPFYRHRVKPGSVKLSLDGNNFGGGGIELSARGKKTDGEGSIVVIRANGGKIPTDLNVDDKLVLVVGEVPGNETFRLYRRNPIAVLNVRPEVKPYDWSVSRSKELFDRRFTSGSISESTARRLLIAVNASAGLLQKPETADTLEVTALPNKVTFSAEVQSEAIGVPNVVGLLEGSDPKLKSQIVGVGAHLDHLGKSGDTIYYGADDDGSGSAALLLTARALAKSSVKPKRSILFMAFCGEEMGLIGSGHYADNPIFPHAQMVAELQMDMVGRDSDGEQNGDSNRVDKAAENTDTMRLVGSKRISTELDAIIQRLNQHTAFKFKYDAEDVYERSDHYNFAKHGIPIAFFFDGFHPDYHQPTDTVEKINFLKLTTTSRLVYLAASELATRPEAPVKDVKAK